MRTAFEQAYHGHGKALRRYGRARHNPISGTTIAVVSLGALAAAAIGFAIYEKSAAANPAPSPPATGPSKATSLSGVNTGGSDVARVGDSYAVQLIGVNAAGSIITWSDNTSGSLKFTGSVAKTVGGIDYVVFSYVVTAQGTGTISITPTILGLQGQPFTYTITAS